MTTAVTVRPVRPSDVPAVVRMVHELAAFERAPGSCHLRAGQLHQALFGPGPALYGHVAVRRPGGGGSPARTAGGPGPGPGPSAGTGRDQEGAGEGEPLGYTLWFLNFSTWEGVHGIYLEDLYVTPGSRGLGVGRQLLAALAATCVQRGYRRLDWSVLHWNPARDFYHALGAVAMDEWVPYRLSGGALRALAAGRPVGAAAQRRTIPEAAGSDDHGRTIPEAVRPDDHGAVP